MNIYITGDCHGDFSKIKYFCKTHNTTKEDIMIILGDVGLNYYLNKRDEKNKKELQKLPLTFLLLQGNHEKYAKNIKGYVKKNIETEQIKGEFYTQDEYPDLLFFINGNNYFINDLHILTLGGAYSVDKWYRLANHYAWFEDEEMTEEEQTDFINKIKTTPTGVDIVLSHTCPYSYMPTHLFLANVDQSTVDNRTERFLDVVEKNIPYRYWFCGHFHADEQLWDKGFMLYDETWKIDKGGIEICI